MGIRGLIDDFCIECMDGDGDRSPEGRTEIGKVLDDLCMRLPVLPLFGLVGKKFRLS